jgi:Effector-associated domain 11
MDQSTKQQLIQLVQHAELEQVIELLLQMNLKSKYRWVAIAISRQFHRYKLDRMKGTTSLQEQQLLESQVTVRLLELIESIKVAREPDGRKWLGYLKFLFSMKGFQFFWGYISSSIVNGKFRWRQWGAIFAVIVLVSGGFLLASNWPMRWLKDGKLGVIPQPRLYRSYVAVVTDTQGSPLVNFIAKLASGRAAPVKTNRHGVLKFGEYFSDDELGDTLELYQNDFCVARRAIRLPGRGEIVVGGNETHHNHEISPATLVDSCELISRILPSSKELSGKIYYPLEAQKTSNGTIGVPNVHVFVAREGCAEPIAGAWTDLNGYYTIHMDSGVPYPDWIFIGDQTNSGPVLRARFQFSLPRFDYPLQK